ncbi:uncharacterized protein LOC124281247 [Haliotis rubra]|uniref:uncharacterized protein LOC124281247 n=1 Tax=Haliotis rubra TaxID=36100 RepID=UPI001EE5E202|nr:uncharacterized protein LOC124281247 [Haliotis rubra]
MASLYNSDSDDDVLEAAVVAMLVDFNHGKADRSCWVRPWIARRSDLGAYKALMRELEAEDTKSFVNFLRMDRESFDQLLGRVSPMITKADTPMRDSIPPGEKLAITLRYLATGDSYKSLEFLYRVPKNTICNFVPQVCVAIYETLKKDFLKVPQSEEEWLQVAEGFEEKWQFPHCPKPLPGRCLDTPYVIVGDDAFPLKDNIMKPYPHRDLVMERKGSSSCGMAIDAFKVSCMPSSTWRTDQILIY